MAHYNHFAPLKFTPLNFNSVELDAKFRIGKYKGKNHRFIICTKISEYSFRELKSKVVHTLSNTDLTVYEYKPTN